MPDTTPKVTYRLMTHADVDAATYISKAAMETVDRASGREPSGWMPSRGRGRDHLIRTDPEGSWVAEVDGLMVGYSQALVRGDIWFLAQLMVQPEVHSLGTGRELLRLAMDYGRRQQARVFSVISSTSPAAQSLYMRAGMFAIGIGYRMSGSVDALRALPEPDASRKRIVDCSGWQDQIAELDAATFGAERRQDHAWYLDPSSAAGENVSFGITRDGKLAGYGYAVDRGWVAPVAAWEPQDQLPLLRMAGDWLAEREVGEANIFAISHNATLIGALLRGGWRINGWNFLLASEPFGRFDRYHPSGGMLL